MPIADAPITIVFVSELFNGLVLCPKNKEYVVRELLVPVLINLPAAYPSAVLNPPVKISLNANFPTAVFSVAVVAAVNACF